MKPLSKNKRRPRIGQTPWDAHPNSIADKIARSKDEDLQRRFKQWQLEVEADAKAMERWYAEYKRGF